MTKRDTNNFDNKWWQHKRSATPYGLFKLSSKYTYFNKKKIQIVVTQ